MKLVMIHKSKLGRQSWALLSKLNLFFLTPAFNCGHKTELIIKVLFIMSTQSFNFIFRLCAPWFVALFSTNSQKWHCYSSVSCCFQSRLVKALFYTGGRSRIHVCTFLVRNIWHLESPAKHAKGVLFTRSHLWGKVWGNSLSTGKPYD